jgi:hypothetical protein
MGKNPNINDEPALIVPPESLSSDREIWWDPSLFFNPDTQDSRCPAVIDVTGRARHVFLGPYLPLAGGVWRARVWLDVCRDAARWPMQLQFGAEPHYSTQDLPADEGGRLEMALEHGFETSEPAQLRLWLKKAAFHGSVRLCGAAVSRVGA